MLEPQCNNYGHWDCVQLYILPSNPVEGNNQKEKMSPSYSLTILHFPWSDCPLEIPTKHQISGNPNDKLPESQLPRTRTRQSQQ